MGATFKKLRRAIQNKRRGMVLGRGIVFINDRPHTANVTRQLLMDFDWEPLDCSSYGPDLGN